MRPICCVVLCLLVVVAGSAALADPASYGVWFDRDSLDQWQQTYWGSVDGGTYNTGGVYDVVIRYSAVSATQAVMAAMINGVSQGFWTTGWQNAQPDFYPAGLSFSSSSLNAMKIFYGQWSGAYAGSAYVSDLKLDGTPYSDFDFSYGSGTGFFYDGGAGNFWVSYGGFGDVYDLTAGDLVLSYTIDLSGLGHVDPAEYLGLGRVFEIGLMPAAGSFELNPGGAGWMGNCWISSAASPGAQGLNDKFDLQNAGGSDEWDYDVTVPEPSSIIALLCGVGSLAGMVRRRK